MALPADGTSTRDRLIAAARDLFWRQGYHATGVASILAEAGVNSGSLYHFFSSKEDLLVAVLRSYEELLWPMVMQPAWDASRDPLERVFAVLDGYRDRLLESGFTRSCPIGNLALEVSDSATPEVRAAIEANFAAWREATARMLAPCGDRLGAPPSEVAELVLAVMEGAVMQARARRSIAPFDTAVAGLRRALEKSSAPHEPSAIVGDTG
jgi:TetR/AcrR family transcriptional regulator, transcriptional repressor for nem operon